MNSNLLASGSPEQLQGSPPSEGRTSPALPPNGSDGGGGGFFLSSARGDTSGSGFMPTTSVSLLRKSGDADSQSAANTQVPTSLPLWALAPVGLVLSVLAFFASHNTSKAAAFSLWGLLALGGLVSAGAGVLSVYRVGNGWLTRARIGWGAIACACLLYSLGCLTNAFLRPQSFSISDWFWIAEQPFLWVGLFVLAWRGRSMGMMRLLADSLIVVLAALVLLWSLVVQDNFFDSKLDLASKTLSLYYPLCDIAHLFCVLMLIVNVRDRPSLTRASWFLLGGVACLITSDALSSFFLLRTETMVGGDHLFWLDLLQCWGILLIGTAALVNAHSPRENPALPLSSVEEAVDAAPEGATSLKTTRLDKAIAHWHRSAMLWLPYLTTLSVSCLLIGREFFGSNSQAIQHVLPVLALLLAIAARQMITLWDNLQLAERLRASNADLERNVNERTHHLQILHGITSTLNTSLDRPTILRVALDRIIQATDGDAGGIWLIEERRDVYGSNVPHEEWTLMHWQGHADPALPALLRDLSIAEVAEVEGITGDNFHLSPATREALQKGLAPPPQRLILVPVRWQGKLMGVMGIVRNKGQFRYEDRELVESVALEAGAALQNARMYTEAANRADRDSVTDLYNHRTVQGKMTEILALCKRSGGVFSIVMMDLNNFKFFNDTYGHLAGDNVLRLVAQGLRESCRGSDILGRYGGDEFIVVLPDTDAAGTLDVCARVKAKLDSKHFEPVAGTRLPIATAFGWAAYPGDGENIMDLLAAADANLYNHKRGGTSYLSQSQKAIQEDRDELKKLKNRAHGGSFGVLDALVTAIDNKDHYTRHHSEEVTYLSLLVARELGYGHAQLEAVRISGLLHDVGKIAVPDQILRHPGKLGRDEWDIMQQHPVFGALIVKDVPHLERVVDGIKYHHEKWDGSGYPEKRVGEDIPEMGRLLAMGDCYSALTTDRPYRKGWEPQAALEEIERCAGTHFDPRLCAIFLEVMRRELELGGDTQDYGTRIAEDFGAVREVEVVTV